MLQLLDGNPVIGIDAHSAGNLHCFFGNDAGAELGMVGEGLGGGLGERASGANGGDAGVGLDHISLAAEEEGGFFVGDDEQGFEVAEEFVGTPVFGELDGGASQVAVVLLEFGLEAAEEGEGVGGRAGESGEDFVLVQAADFLGAVLDN